MWYHVIMVTIITGAVSAVIGFAAGFLLAANWAKDAVQKYIREHQGEVVFVEERHWSPEEDEL